VKTDYGSAHGKYRNKEERKSGEYNQRTVRFPGKNAFVYCTLPTTYWQRQKKFNFKEIPACLAILNVGLAFFCCYPLL